MLVHRVEPEYPQAAKRAGIEGRVDLRVIVARDGSILNLTVERGHPLLAAAAMEAAKRWRYRPYLLNGEPVEIATSFSINFTLHPEREPETRWKRVNY